VFHPLNSVVDDSNHLLKMSITVFSIIIFLKCTINVIFSMSIEEAIQIDHWYPNLTSSSELSCSTQGFPNCTDAIICFSLPKCGSTFWSHAISKQWKDVKVGGYRARCVDNSTILNPVIRQNFQNEFGLDYNLIGTHWDLSVFTSGSILWNKNIRNIFTITNLRHPLSRLISAYSYGRYGNITFQQFAENDIAFARKDFMTRYLAGMSPCSLYNNDLSNTLSEEELLSLAVKNLISLSFFSILEKQELSMRMLAKLLNRTGNEMNEMIGLATEKINGIEEKKKETYNPTKEEIESVDKIIALDLRLYEIATAVFMKRSEI